MTTTQPQYDDHRARRNAIVLSAAQAFYGCSTIVLFATAGLVGVAIAPEKGLATLPITSFVVGTALSTIPASLLMRRIGRRAGFMIGAGAGVASNLLAVAAILVANFWLFVFATMLQGVYQAFSQYYRFAAADLASPGFRPKAISWVMLGGMAGAILVPGIVALTKDLLGPILFIGTYAFSVLMAAAGLVVLSALDIPNPKDRSVEGEARPLGVILRQPRLLAAMLAGMTAYGVMSFVMTATPIAMVDCGFSVEQSAWVIQWHALAMFAPSFFTGSLINRFGVERIVFIGMGLLVAAAIAGLAGISFANFSIGLILLGVGWNFGYVGGTTMVTETYRPAEKNKVQAVNDFAIFAAVACASLISGKLLDAVGWSAVNWSVLPIVGVTLAVLAALTLALSRKSAIRQSP